MTTATTRRALRLLLATASLSLLVPAAHALVLDDRGEMRFGLRSYTALRVGTSTMGGEDNPLTWPNSGAGHIRQNRFFLELKLDHDVKRLIKTNPALGKAFEWMDLTKLSYSVQYRGEWEGIYNYGPQEFSDQGDSLRRFRSPVPKLNIPGIANLDPDGADRRHPAGDAARQHPAIDAPRNSQVREWQHQRRLYKQVRALFAEALGAAAPVADAGAQARQVRHAHRPHAGVFHEQHAMPARRQTRHDLLVALPDEVPVNRRNADDVASVGHASARRP